MSGFGTTLESGTTTSLFADLLTRYAAKRR